MEKCLLCDFVKCVGGKTLQCGPKGIETIIKCSDIRKDGASELFKGKTSVELHDQCRKVYTKRPNTSTAHEQVQKVRRSTATDFNFQLHCLFCDRLVDVQHPDRMPFCQVETLEIIRSIREYAVKRNDEWGEQVTTKLNTVSDLVAAAGRYHRDCYNYFKRVGSSLPGSSSIKGKISDAVKSAAFEKLCQELEEDCDDCQYTLAELILKMKEYDPTHETYSKTHLRRKLKEKFGEGVVFTERQGQISIVCFTGVAHKVLSENWYSNRNANTQSERLRVIQTAARLLRQDILSKPYDTSCYPSASDMSGGGQDLVPDTLQLFLEELLQTKTNKVHADKERKAVAIGQVVVSALRPRSFLSPLLFGLGVTLHRLFGSKLLIDMLHNLGFCSSYKEAGKYEDSVVKSAPATIDQSAYVQAVFDNADHNVRTLDGHGTWHTMGGVLCATPKSALHADKPVTRPSSGSRVTSAENEPNGYLPIQHYITPDHDGYSKLIAVDMTNVDIDCDTQDLARSLDFLWASGLWSGASPHPGWSGYMVIAHQSQPYEVSAVIPMPFINLNPSNNSTIFTALSYAANICVKQNQTFIMVTFDQQLYCKAVAMVLAEPSDSPLNRVIVRLGSFHLLKSFLGAIGSIMAGSGLEECLSTVYAKNTVEQMTAGNAIARAVRGHFLVQLAIFTLLLETMPNPHMQESLRELSNQLMTGQISPKEVQNSPYIRQGLGTIQEELAKASTANRTSKLWAQYLEMITLIHMLLRAERSGDWNLHLLTVKRMLPYFHAAGHLNYAKSAQVYLQQMMEIKTKLPENEFQKFVEEGYFTIRRTAKFWSGLPTDLTIEQVLMRSIKSVGGLTRGRGLTESTVSKWVQCSPTCVTIIDSIENFCNVLVPSNEEHVDLRESRQKRDHLDTCNILDWLRLHPPFCRTSPSLVNIATGRIANEKVNCDRALDIGMESMKKMQGIPFNKISLRRKDAVISLAAGVKGMVVRDKIVNVNPDQLFHRMLCMKQSDEELKEFLNYELREPPPALFDDFSMRQGTKSTMMSIFPTSDSSLEMLRASLHRYVVDGGFLLRQISWLKTETYGEICAKYVAYLRMKFRGRITVVFDGYGDASTKDIAHARRTLKGSSIDIIVQENETAIINQDTFLSNGRNKTSLIALLTKKLQDVGIEVVQAAADADRLIVTTAICYSEQQDETVIIGQDTDLAVLLTALSPPQVDIKLLMPGIKGKPAKLYSSQKCQESLGEMKDLILFLHAATGCDTTSALFNIGKVKPFKRLQKDKSVRQRVGVFNLPNATPDDIATAGEMFVLSLYPGKTSDDLGMRRFENYIKINSRLPTNKKFDLAQLPPTSPSSREHSLRVYLQVQEWLGNPLPPTDWGFEKDEEGHLRPVTNRSKPAPDRLLEMVSCNCTQGCETRNCSCRRHKIVCSNICGHCAGHGCSNTLKEDEDNDDDPGDLEPIPGTETDMEVSLPEDFFSEGWKKNCKYHN